MLLALVVTLALAAGPLDGKTFQGTMSVVGRTDVRSTDLEFKDGRFRSSAGEAIGFRYGPYSAKRTGDSWSFRARVSGGDQGTMDWRGVVTEDGLTGTATWTRTGRDPVNFRVEAQLQ